MVPGREGESTRGEKPREREREGERMRGLAGRGIVTRSLNLVVDCR